MSVVVFSHYCLTGNEEAPFQVGQTPRLDEYDGFYDQALESQPPGRRLLFLLNEGKLINPATRSCRVLRDRLDQAGMITGTLRDVVYCHIEKRESFADVFRAKPRPTENEILDIVDHERLLWQGNAQAAKTWVPYWFTFVGQLPTVPGLERAFSGRLVCEKPTDFGNARQDTRRWLPYFLEPMHHGAWVRVIALGSNDIDNCRVYDVTNLDEYRESLRERSGATRRTYEKNAWRYLLGQP